jgi:hypothetical protein
LISDPLKNNSQKSHDPVAFNNSPVCNGFEKKNRPDKNINDATTCKKTFKKINLL